MKPRGTPLLVEQEGEAKQSAVTERIDQKKLELVYKS